MNYFSPTEICVLLRRRNERDSASGSVRYEGYDPVWPDGRPVGVGVQRFCQHGTRLLIGRGSQVAEALVKLSLYPVPNLDAPLTRPGPGIRCRRLYAVRERDEIRLFFLNGIPTEIVFDPIHDEDAVLEWLHADQMREGEPFWFDLASRSDATVQAV